MMEYGIDLETCKAWKQEAPQNRPYAKRYHAADPVLLKGALVVLQQLFPDQQSAYDEIEIGLKIYLAGFYDSVRNCVKTWLKKSGNPQLIIQLLQELNTLFQANTPPDQIPSSLIDRAPDHTKPLFQLLINFYKEVAGIDAVIGMCKSIFPNMTESNFMSLYLLGAVLPFNFMLASIVSIVTFLVYKKISFLFKKDFVGKNKKEEKQNENIDNI